MGKKGVLRALVIMVLVYPAYMLFMAANSLDSGEIAPGREAILNYQVSIWISWIFLVAIAVYYKWTEKRNSFFYFTYGFLVVAFAVFGYLHQSLVNIHDLPSPFQDGYTLGVLLFLQNLVVSSILTGFLQATVWWFTRRWHRR